MGQSGSKPGAPEAAEVDAYTDNMIGKLKESIDSLNKNDIKSMRRVVESMPESKRLTGNMLKHIVKVISNTETSLEMVDKPAKSMKNDELKSYIDTITMRKVTAIKDDIEKEKGEIENPELKKSVDTLFIPVATMHTKYKYYFYKYVQLNIFLILFANHVQEVMNIQYAKILDYMREQSAKDEQLVKNLVSMMTKIANLDDPQLDASQRDDIERLGNDAMSAAASRIDNLEQFVEKMKKNSFEEIIKMFVDTQEEIVKEIEGLRK